MFIILKSFSGLNYNLGKRTIYLKGGAFLNQVSKDDFELIRDTFPSFQKMIDKGFIIAQDLESEAQKKSQVAVDDVKAETAAAQEAAQEANAKKTSTKKVKAEK